MLGYKNHGTTMEIKLNALALKTERPSYRRNIFHVFIMFHFTVQVKSGFSGWRCRGKMAKDRSSNVA